MKLTKLRCGSKVWDTSVDFFNKYLEHSISKAAQERQTKDFTTKNQQLAFELEKMKAENDRLQKQNDLLERERVSDILVFFDVFSPWNKSIF